MITAKTALSMAQEESKMSDDECEEQVAPGTYDGEFSTHTGFTTAKTAISYNQATKYMSQSVLNQIKAKQHAVESKKQLNLELQKTEEVRKHIESLEKMASFISHHFLTKNSRALIMNTLID